MDYADDGDLQKRIKEAKANGQQLEEQKVFENF
jgi:hypothetical protein